MDSIMFINPAALGCRDGRCEDQCLDMESFIFCVCTNDNETLAPDGQRICVCKFATHVLSS